MPIKVRVERNYTLIPSKPTTLIVEGDTVNEVASAIQAIEAIMDQEAANYNPGA